MCCYVQFVDSNCKLFCSNVISIWEREMMPQWVIFLWSSSTSPSHFDSSFFQESRRRPALRWPLGYLPVFVANRCLKIFTFSFGSNDIGIRCQLNVFAGYSTTTTNFPIFNAAFSTFVHQLCKSPDLPAMHVSNVWFVFSSNAQQVLFFSFAFSNTHHR